MPQAFICAYTRTPIGRFGGALAHIRTDDLAALPIRALINQSPQADWQAVDDVFYGCANQAGEDNRNVARMAALLAGLPPSVPGVTINRLCGSGMDAILTAARAIKAGEIDLAIAGGVESMSRAPLVMPKAAQAFSRDTSLYDTTIGWRFVNPRMQAAYGTDSMPETAENVADQLGISRQDQDTFAAWSQAKANTAQTSGRLAQEITPVSVPIAKGDTSLIHHDEHPRPDTTAQTLAKLMAPFRNDKADLVGTVTAGNASGINDGAAALIIASEPAVRQHGLTPMARIVGGACAGLAPRIMGLGPVPATHKLMQRIGLTQADFDIIELNEAFAAQALGCLRQLGIADDDPRVNPNGGAIALGHPLGMSGTRITGSAALQLANTDDQRALATMCIGVGQGIAIALERV